MNFLEKDLEEIIYTTDYETLNDRGLPLAGKLFRQFNLGKYGICDLLTVKTVRYDGRLVGLAFTIFELKKDSIGKDTFFQAIRYAYGIREYLLSRGFTKFNFRIRLIGKHIEKSPDAAYLCNLFDTKTYHPDGKGNIMGIHFYTYSYKIDGLWFIKYNATTNEE